MQKFKVTSEIENSAGRVTRNTSYRTEAELDSHRAWLRTLPNRGDTQTITVKALTR